MKYVYNNDGSTRIKSVSNACNQNFPLNHKMNFNISVSNLKHTMASSKLSFNDFKCDFISLALWYTHISYIIEFLNNRVFYDSFNR